MTEVENVEGVEVKQRRRAKAKTGVRVEKGKIIEFGSDEHRAWLGIDREPDPIRKAALQEALDAGEPEIHAEGKMPIGKHFNAPGAEIVEGFKRRGDGTGN